MNENRHIPEPIKREVRQRCGFGCVICGFPIYEYEHMEEWAKVKRHLASEITLLCNKHHREKTAGFLPKGIVVKANNEPFNLRKNVSKPFNLHFTGNKLEFENSENRISLLKVSPVTQIIPILAYGLPLLRILLLNDEIYITLHLFDEEDNLLLRIVDNELVYRVDIWDIYFVGTKLFVKQESRNILIEMEFIPPNRIIIVKGVFRYKGFKLEIKKGGFYTYNLEDNSNSKIVLKNMDIGFPNIAIINFKSPLFIGFTLFKVGD